MIMRGTSLVIPSGARDPFYQVARGSERDPSSRTLLGMTGLF
jgi:hypothetical protein